ncbi:MAG: hypothetical protein Q9218_001626 [Villophora microphyllina]
MELSIQSGSTKQAPSSHNPAGASFYRDIIQNLGSDNPPRKSKPTNMVALPGGGGPGGGCGGSVGDAAGGLGEGGDLDTKTKVIIAVSILIGVLACLANSFLVARKCRLRRRQEMEKGMDGIVRNWG